MIIVHGRSPVPLDDLVRRLQTNVGDHAVHVAVEDASETSIVVLLPAGCAHSVLEAVVAEWSASHGLEPKGIRVLKRSPPMLVVVHSGDAELTRVVQRLTERFGWEQVTQVLGVLPADRPRMLFLLADERGTLLNPEDVSQEAHRQFQVSGVSSPRIAALHCSADLLRQVIAEPHRAFSLLRWEFPTGFLE